MGKKKKTSDFQKVKIKVGRKLKRKNETVIDLTRKKIKLPSEKKRPETVDTHSRSVDDIIQSLGLEQPAVQLASVKSLNEIFDPFIRRVASLGYSEISPLTIQFRSVNELVSIRCSIFGVAALQLGLQLGRLLACLTRVSGTVQDPRLCRPLLALFTNIMKLASLWLDLLPEAIASLEVAAFSLLQRPESTWMWLGCRLTGLAMRLRCHLLQVASLCPTGTNWWHSSAGTQLVDVMRHLPRCSLFRRALLRLFEQLEEMRSVREVSQQRLHLLHTCLAHLKDDQYSMTAGLGTAHPFLMPQPLFASRDDPANGSDWAQSMEGHLPVNGYAFGAGPLVLGVDSALLEVETSRSSALGRNCRDSDWLADQRLTMGLLHEGTILLADIQCEVNDTTLISLYCLLRGLRALFEAKLSAVIPLLSKSPTGGTVAGSLQEALRKFLNKLYTVFPIQTATTATPTKGVSSRSESKKSARATLSAQADRSTIIDQLAQAVNQAVLELFADLDRQPDRAEEAPMPLVWPPPTESQVRQIADYLQCGLPKQVADRTLQTGSLFAWLRAFDIYLLSPRRRHQQGSKRSDLFTTPVVVSLWRLMQHVGGELTQPIASNAPTSRLSRGKHRLLGRIVGLLTTVLASSSQLGSHDNGDVDRWSLSGQLGHDTASQIVKDLVDLLVQLVQREPPRLVYTKPLGTTSSIISGHLTDLLPLEPGDGIQKEVVSRPIQLVDNTWASCLHLLSTQKLPEAVDRVSADAQLSHRLQLLCSRESSSGPMSLDVLLVRIGVETGDLQGAREEFSSQMGWLVPGYLPSLLDGRYASAFFWKVPQGFRLPLLHDPS